MRRLRILATLGISLGPMLAIACFPDFQVASSGGPGAASDGSTLLDGTSPTTGDGPPSTLPDGAPLPDGALPDGNPGMDGAVAFDAAASRVIPSSAPGNFQFADETALNIVSVAITHDFYMDTHESTVGRFKQWVAAAKPAPAAGSLDPGGPHEAKMVWDPAWNSKVAFEGYKDTGNCTDTLGANGALSTPTYPGANDAIPINCITWFQAAAFCWWDGQKRLPTQVEWQYVASGRNRARTYPWGDTPLPDCAHAIHRGDGGSPDYNGCFFPKIPGSAPAGASFDAVDDMAGSVFEFTWDWQSFTYPATWPNDYSGPDSGSSRMARGGSFVSQPIDLDTKRYASISDSGYYADLGVRCVKTKL